MCLVGVAQRLQARADFIDCLLPGNLLPSRVFVAALARVSSFQRLLHTVWIVELNDARLAAAHVAAGRNPLARVAAPLLYALGIRGQRVFVRSEGCAAAERRR